ncbi:MAG: hypothetical protein ACRDKB_02150 [Actinomycetota bacterium]
MSAYQVFLLIVIILWPFAVFGGLFLMSRLERYVNRLDASTPEEAGLEPVSGTPTEREVTIVFGDRVVGEPESERSEAKPTG